MSAGTVHERFTRWLASKGWTQEKAAAELRCHQTMVSRIRAGKRKPGRALAARIEELSADSPEGQIKAADWDSEAEAA